MKYSASLLLPLFFVLVSCDKELETGQTNISEPVSNYPDEPFGIGRFDSNDYHLEFSDPLRPYYWQYDLDRDGNDDLAVGHYFETLSNGSESGTYLETTAGSGWGISVYEFKDSVYKCINLLEPWLSFEFNSVATHCTYDRDSFLGFNGLVKVPHEYQETDNWPSSSDWRSSTFHEYSFTTQAPNIYFKYPGMTLDTTDHFILLEKSSKQGPQKAWIRVQRQNGNAVPRVLIKELAVQAEGSL